jgi:LPS-assembly lipoprotein
LSHKRNLSGAARVVIAAAMAAGLLVVSGCQVRPLYADSATTSGVPTGTHAALSQIAIKPVNTRYAQEVRNQLIFLFGGGRGQGAAGRYSMNLIVTANHENVARVQIGDESDLSPTAGTVTMIASYNISDTETGQIVASGTREITASYDNPRQEFAAMRAKRDAENRAARELAQVVQLAVAQQLQGG